MIRLLVFIFSIQFFFISSIYAYDLQKIEGSHFIVDLRYHSDQNFLKKNVYQAFDLKECYVHPDLFILLKKLEPQLESKKLKLVFWDCYRPLNVQKEMWKLVPDSRFVANPKNGSNHNRGIAVDISLANVEGKDLSMPTAFDDFSAKASPAYICPKAEAEKCKNRDLLMALMATIGLKPLNSEWWHYQLSDSKKYPLIEKLDIASP